MHIAVVGAGPAGLTAAYRLQEAGDRTQQACVEGDVRSGEAAAAAFSSG